MLTIRRGISCPKTAFIVCSPGDRIAAFAEMRLGRNHNQLEKLSSNTRTYDVFRIDYEVSLITL